MTPALKQKHPAANTF